MYHASMRRTLLALLTLLVPGCQRHPDVPLIQAVASGDTRAIEDALARGAYVNQKDARGLTPLIIASRNGNTVAVQTLIRHGADPNLRGGVNDWPPLMHGIHKNRIDTVRVLLDSGADVNGRGRSGETALMMAAGYGYTPIVELLLDRGADTRAKMPDGANVFSIALGGVPDIDRFTVGACQIDTIKALKRKDPGLSLPQNLWGGAAKLSAVLARLRGCPY
jgi:ankyrin repeat protein